MRIRISLALCALLACGDGGIGALECIGEAIDCERPPGFVRTQLPIPFIEVSTMDPGELPVTWELPNPCAEQPCARPAQLLPYQGDGVWNVPRTRPAPALELIRADASRSDVAFPPPVDSTYASGAFAPQPDGRVLAHLQWSEGTRIGPDEVAFLGAAPEPQRSMLRESPRARLPTGAIATPRGFLLFPDRAPREEQVPQRRVLQLTPDGTALWQQVAFPAVVQRIGGTATSYGGGFVLSADDATSRPIYGLLWLGLEGQVQRMTITADSWWRGLQLLPTGPESFVMAAPSDIRGSGVIGVDADRDGNIDVVHFAGQEPVVGYRLLRACFYPLLLHGLAHDGMDSTYVTSLVGDQEAPRGLLCRLTNGAGRCYQAPPGRLLGAVVAVRGQPGVLYAALDDAIARIELPSP